MVDGVAVEMWIGYVVDVKRENERLDVSVRWGKRHTSCCFDIQCSPLTAKLR